MPPLDQLLAAAIGLIGVVVGALITAVTERKREEKRAEREREARQEEYVRHRRDEFEKVLVEFVPIHKQWWSLQEIAIRERYGEMADTDPMSDEEALEASEKQMDRYIAQLRVRSPSDRLTAILGDVARCREVIQLSMNYMNHVGLEGDEGDRQEAKENLYEALDEFGEKVEAAVRENSAGARDAEAT